MVAKAHHIPELRRRLKKYIKDFGLVSPFTHLTVRGSAASAILYHDNTFNEVQSIISYNKDFNFDDKYIAVVPLTGHVKLCARVKGSKLPEEDLEALQSWV